MDFISVYVDLEWVLVKRTVWLEARAEAVAVLGCDVCHFLQVKLQSLL